MMVIVGFLVIFTVSLVVLIVSLFRRWSEEVQMAWCVSTFLSVFALFMTIAIYASNSGKYDIEYATYVGRRATWEALARHPDEVSSELTAFLVTEIQSYNGKIQKVKGLSKYNPVKDFYNLHYSGADAFDVGRLDKKR